MKNKKLFYVLFFALILALSCVFVSAEEIETPETEIEEEEYEGDPTRPSALHLNFSSLTIGRGEMVKLSLTQYYPMGTISWSSNSSCVVVSSDGTIRGVSRGTATITVTQSVVPSGFTNTATCIVTVTPNGVLENGDYLLKSRFDLLSNWYAYESSQAPSNSSYVTLQNLQRTGCFWTFVLGNDGYYTIRSSYSGKLLLPYNNSLVPGTHIVHTQTVTNSCKWAIMKDNTGKYSFVPYGCSNGSVRLGAEMSEDETYMCLCSFNSSNVGETQWSLTRMLPLSGAEFDFDYYSLADDWDGNYTTYQYALNIRHYYLDPYPSIIDIVEGLFGGEEIDSSEEDGNVIISAVESDNWVIQTATGETYVFESVGRYEVCPDETYKVALFTGGSGHIWMRQDSDGFWSYIENRGNQATLHCFDDTGALIADPSLFFSEDYATFVGFFAVTPWN